MWERRAPPASPRCCIPTYGTSETFIKDSDSFAHGLNERLPVKSFYDGLEH